jgi:pimeloyl-ACP methyl ester carboxylesterase
MISLRDPIAGACPRAAERWARTALAQAQELRAMAAVAAMAPLGRVGRCFERTVDAVVPVTAQTAPRARPVLLVHGFASTKSCWLPLARALRAGGVPVEAFNYLPLGTSVEQLAELLADKVATLLAETGVDKVHLVGHSLGGVVIAQAFATGRLAGQVDTVITIASPFGGSPWATLLPLGATVRSLRSGSPLLRRIAAAPVPHGVRWVAFTSTLDAVVPGGRALPPQADVETVTVHDVGHVGLLMNREVVARIFDALPTPQQAAA